jgi:hypothetical protein
MKRRPFFLVAAETTGGSPSRRYTRQAETPAAVPRYAERKRPDLFSIPQWAFTSVSSVAGFVAWMRGEPTEIVFPGEVRASKTSV